MWYVHVCLFHSRIAIAQAASRHEVTIPSAMALSASMAQGIGLTAGAHCCIMFAAPFDCGQVASAEALRLVVLLKNTEIVEGGAYVDPIPDAWELEFIDVGQVR